MLQKLVLIPLLLLTINVFGQRGKNGSYTVTALNTQLNAYTTLSANVSAGATTLSVASNALTNTFFTASLAAGDLIMIIQMQGAYIDVDSITAVPVASGGWGGSYTVPEGHQIDWPSYQDLWGRVTYYNNSGKYEVVEVNSVSGTTTINLMCGLVNSYTASGHVQIVRIPRLTDLSLNASTSIVPALWSATTYTGGVLALEVNGTLTFGSGSKISASGFGFNGGTTDNLSGGPAGSATDVGFCASSDQYQGAEKGEGIGGFTTEYNAIYSKYGKSAPANGGGGANYKNAGGGGGCNVGTGTYTGKGVPSSTYAAFWELEQTGLSTSFSSGGGRGGYSGAQSNQNEATLGPNNAAWTGDYRRKEGGFGGHPLAYDATRAFMGGGGGAGDMDQSQGGNGGRGGGIVFIRAYGTVTGTGTIEANGANGQNANATNAVAVTLSATKYGIDGAGGAGGGGAIMISNASALPNTLTLSATGGNGGNEALSFGQFASGNEADGPGGGGGGGMIAFTSGSPVQTVSGGANGIVTVISTYPTTNIVSAFPPNGATGGASGMSGLTQAFFDLTSPNVTICPNTSTTLLAAVSGSLPSGAAVTWYASQFGSTILGTGTSYTTPVLLATTTYYVGTCPGSFRIPVVVTVSGAASISGTLTIPVGGTTLLTGSGTPSAVTPWTSSATGIGTITSAGLVTGVAVGTTTITYITATGCLATAIVTVTAPLPVELLAFTAQLNESGDVSILWTTETEVNNDYFVVQRSSDVFHWQEIALVEGVGNSETLNHYRTADNSPVIGINYYRLKQVDYNGQYKTSEIRSVEVGMESLLVYPNPATNGFYLKGASLEKKEFRLLNGMGQQIPIVSTVFSEDTLWIDTRDIAPGVYFLQIAEEGQTALMKVTLQQL